MKFTSIIIIPNINYTANANVLRENLKKMHIESVIRLISHQNITHIHNVISDYENDSDVICYMVYDPILELQKLIGANTIKPVLQALNDIEQSTVAVLKLCALKDISYVNLYKYYTNYNIYTEYFADIELKYDSQNEHILEWIHQPHTTIPFNDINMGKYKLLHSGKVRDIYIDETKTETEVEQITLFASDKLSAFDRHWCNVPYKGLILNLISIWWFENTKHIVENHLLGYSNRQMIVKKCDIIPIEFVVRGYLTGTTETSILVNYERGVRNYCGHELPNGLSKYQKLSENILTPTTKGKTDELTSKEEIIAKGTMTVADYEYCEAKALELFKYGQQIADERELILVDTKYEFGRDSDGNIILVDEVHTPDSSRYWIKHTYYSCFKLGQSPSNIDKEFLRKHIKAGIPEGVNPHTCDQSELPVIDDNLILETSKKYMQLYELITGQTYDIFDTIPDFSNQ
jgi:phosphoribosylaminoimidazole-succinocarboxamide synthase